MASQTLEHPLTKSAATRAEAHVHEPILKARAAPVSRSESLARAVPAISLYTTVIACAVEDRSGKY